MPFEEASTGPAPFTAWPGGVGAFFSAERNAVLRGIYGIRLLLRCGCPLACELALAGDWPVLRETEESTGNQNGCVPVLSPPASVRSGLACSGAS